MLVHTQQYYQIKVTQNSPVNAVEVMPPFDKFLFIDLKGNKIDYLKNTLGEKKTIRYETGDCNPILLNILPKITKDRRERALCILDPYGLDIDWKVVELAGTMGTIELFYHFPIMGINRSALWRRNPDNVPPKNVKRFNYLWGSEGWKRVAYREYQETLWGETEKEKITKCDLAMVEAFKQHLIKDAHFKCVPDPMPMKHSGGTIYYLFFAAQVPVAEKIIRDIFNKYR
ncbi:MAG: three-Cys-motif partner protein TcmP [bacterium]|nr:three-Cys-motif partner protein TcmP [bacterium]